MYLRILTIYDICAADSDSDGDAYWRWGDRPSERDSDGQRHAAIAQFEVTVVVVVVRWYYC